MANRSGMSFKKCMWAAWKGYSEIIKILLENGANKNAPNFGGDTPISLARKHRNEDILNILINDD